MTDLGGSQLTATQRSPLSENRTWLVDRWDTDDGLPHNSVTTLLQTRDGYLWLGTPNGLVRFDGLGFAVFDEQNTPRLNSSRITLLFEDSQTNLWVGTETAGVALIQGGQISTLSIGVGGPEKRLASISEEANGNVWLYTANGELWRYSASSRSKLTPFRFELFRPSANRFIMTEPSGPVWIGTDWRQSAISSSPDLLPLELKIDRDFPVTKLDGLLASKRGGYWRLADGHIQKCLASRIERDWGVYPWRSGPVTAICEDLQGGLLIGTRSEGIFWLTDDGKMRRLSRQEGLTSDNILSLCVDQEGALWIGTDAGGLNRVRQPVFSVLDLSLKSSDPLVQSVSEDDQGGLWIGSRNGEITYIRDGMQQVFGPTEGLLMADIWCVFVDRHQDIWAGTGGAGLLKLQQGIFVPAPGFDLLFHTVHALYQDRQGQLWAGTQGGLARREGDQWRTYTTADGLSANDVRAITDDEAGSLWIGTMGGGLNRWRHEQFTAWRKQDSQGLSSDDITSLHLDREGTLWIGTLTGGLNRFDGNQWTHYTTQVGLPSNHIGYMVEDELGNLWIGSNTGLVRIRKQELEDFAARKTTFVSCRVFGKPDGLPTRACTSGSQPGGCRTRDGTLWFPTAKGLASLNPLHLSRNPHAPPVTIESVFIDGQAQNTNTLKVILPALLTVPAGRERVEIHYNSLSLSAPNKSRYQYCLEGYETKWTEAGNSRIARYSRLPPGRYRFHVKAGNEDGVWNEQGSSLALIVQPPLWRKGWFLGLTVTVVLGSIIAGVHFVSTQRLQRQLERLRHQEALEKERARIAQDIHDQLGASLTQVALLGELIEGDKNDPGEVENHARQITLTARETTRTLDEIVWAVNPSNDTLDSLINYLCKHAQDYLAVAGLRYRLDVPSDLPSLTIPPEFRHHLYLTFKEAITNVVRHANAQSVLVRLQLGSGTFTLEIEDDGRGIAPMDEKTALARNGLRGMRKRIESLGGRLVIGPGSPRGTRVEITTPIHS